MTVQVEVAPAPAARSPWAAATFAQRSRRRRLLLAVLIAFLALSVPFGFPTGREVVIGWVLVVLWAACAGQWRVWARAVVHDWLPFLVVLFLYDLVRGLANELAARLFTLPALANGKPGPNGLDHAHIVEPLHGDEHLFGVVPTVWLQDRFYDAAHVHWYDVVAVPIYFSHFLVSLAIAIVLWAVSYQLFRRYVWTLVTLTLATVTTYALYPAAPPWMASLNGYLPPGVDRVVPHTLVAVGGHTVNSAVERGATYANAVAAMPSLHGAVPMMLLLFFWPLVGRRLRGCLVAYVVVMTLTLVYGGEHYVTDVLAGWLYAAGAVAVVAIVGPSRATAVDEKMLTQTRSPQS